jgi:hypothetical protein
MNRCTVTSLVTAGALALSPIAVGLTQPAQGASTSASAQRAESTKATRNLTFKTEFTSVDSIIKTLPGGVSYGRNHLRGKTTWGNRHGRVEFMAVLNYVDGNGPFNGNVTVTRSDGASIAFTTTGSSLSTGSGTSDASFRGLLTVIGGTGPFEGATGVGTLTGSRRAELGGAVRMTFNLTIAR